MALHGSTKEKGLTLWETPSRGNGKTYEIKRLSELYHLKGGFANDNYQTNNVARPRKCLQQTKGRGE